MISIEELVTELESKRKAEEQNNRRTLGNAITAIELGRSNKDNGLGFMIICYSLGKNKFPIAVSKGLVNKDPTSINEIVSQITDPNSQTTATISLINPSKQTKTEEQSKISIVKIDGEYYTVTKGKIVVPYESISDLGLAIPEQKKGTDANLTIFSLTKDFSSVLEKLKQSYEQIISSLIGAFRKFGHDMNNKLGPLINYPKIIRVYLDNVKETFELLEEGLDKSLIDKINNSFKRIYGKLESMESIAEITARIIENKESYLNDGSLQKILIQEELGKLPLLTAAYGIKKVEITGLFNDNQKEILLPSSFYAAITNAVVNAAESMEQETKKEMKIYSGIINNSEKEALEEILNKVLRKNDCFIEKKETNDEHSKTLSNGSGSDYEKRDDKYLVLIFSDTGKGLDPTAANLLNTNGYYTSKNRDLNIEEKILHGIGTRIIRSFAKHAGGRAYFVNNNELREFLKDILEERPILYEQLSRKQLLLREHFTYKPTIPENGASVIMVLPVYEQKTQNERHNE